MATDKHEAKTDLLPAVLVALGVVGVGGFITVTAMTESTAQAELATQSIDLERPAKDLKFQQRGDLVAPVAWAEKTKATASIPVDRAMAIVVKTLQDNPALATPAPLAPKEPAADADGGTDAEATDSDAGAEGAVGNGDAGAAATDAGVAAEAATPVAPKPVAPKPAPPPPVAPAPVAPDPTPPTTP